MHLNMVDCTYLHTVFLNQLGIWFRFITHAQKNGQQTKICIKILH